MASDRAAPRVAYLTHVAQPSGAEIALERLVTALGDRVRPLAVLMETGPMEARLRRAGAQVRVLQLARGARTLRREEAGRGRVAAVAASALYAIRLARVLRVLHVDVVHANSLKAGVIGGFAARLARRPLVWHVHDRLAPEYLHRRAVRPLQTLVRRLPSAVIANSRATLDTLPGAPNAVVVPNPLELADIVYSPPSGADPDHVLCFGMVGRFTPWKGQAEFLRAFAVAFPSGDERAVFVGSALFGEEGYETSVHRLADELGLAGRVEFRGQCADVFAELATFDVLVHASIIPEPFGQVLVEAGAAGVPVLASAGGGVLELLRDGEDALLHRPGDVGQLASHLRRMAADPGLRRALATRHHSALGRFAPDAVAEQVRAVYRTVAR